MEVLIAKVTRSIIRNDTDQVLRLDFTLLMLSNVQYSKHFLCNSTTLTFQLK